MKKMYLTAAFIAVVISSLNVYALLKNEKPVDGGNVTLTALAQNSEGGGNGEGSGVEDCDIKVYNRNYAEAMGTEIFTSVDLSAGVGITLPTGVRIPIGELQLQGKTQVMVRFPFCEKSDGNCCAKDYLKGEIQIIPQ